MRKSIASADDHGSSELRAKDSSRDDATGIGSQQTARAGAEEETLLGVLLRLSVTWAR